MLCAVAKKVLKKKKYLAWALRGVVLDSDSDSFHCSFMSNTGHVTTLLGALESALANKNTSCQMTGILRINNYM